MKVTIDGIEYVPMPEPVDVEGLQGALELRLDSDAGENITVRDYLRILLEKVWEDGEGFSGKRPFGNSGWEHDLYRPLALGGYIKGDAEGFVEWEDRSGAHDFVVQLIRAAFRRPA